MRRGFGVLVTVVAFVVASSPATAKGVTSLRIEGPGLDASIVLTSSGGDLSEKATEIAMATSVYAQAIPTSSLPLLDHSPATSLGPRYTAIYVLDAIGTTFVQHIYPFAQPNAVTFAPPGQRWSDGQRSRSGWTVGSVDLRSTLVEVGVPVPGSPDRGGSDWVRPAAVITLAASGMALILSLLLWRRHRRPIAVATPT